MGTDDVFGLSQGESGRGHHLASISVKSMLSHQVASGAFFASMDFAPYRYCWLRDGSFTAFALDRAGEQEAAEKFHRWAAAAVAGIAPTIRAATERRLAGGTNDAASMPPARYTVDGAVERDGWPNFQIDGYGTWLWAVSEHVAHWGTKTLADELGESLELVTTYLEAVALDPCYDCWEENGQAVHTSTLACVYGGLSAAGELLGSRAAERRAAEVAEYIHSRLRNRPAVRQVERRRQRRRQPPLAGRTLRRRRPGRHGHDRHSSRGRAGPRARRWDPAVRGRYVLRRWRLAAANGVARLVPGQDRRPAQRGAVGRMGRALLRRRRPSPRAGRRRTPRPRFVP